MATQNEQIVRPQDPQQAIWQLQDDVQRLRDEMNAFILGLQTVVYAAPSKPREGVFAYADGTTWNPGGGKGLYQYQGGVWTKL